MKKPISITARVCLGEVATWARARQIITTAALTGRTADVTAQEWAAAPANWCDRPGCPKCWNGGSK